MDLKLISDKYRPSYGFEGIPTGVKVKKTNVDGSIVSRFITDKEFSEQLRELLNTGYTIELVRE
jgi:hypothetical protein